MKSHTHLPSLESHYALLLGLVSPWMVRNVELDVERATLDIFVAEHEGAVFPCPECAAPSPLHDHAPERRWRHLDTMQCTTEIVARLPRIFCSVHGVLTATVPWAGAHSRWTLLFESFAIRVLQGASNITRALALLGIGWEQMQGIQERAVRRGLEQRKDEVIEYVGMDEKSFLRGHKYASVLTDLTRGRVLDVVQERTKESAKRLIAIALTPGQLGMVKAAAMDMWKPFMDAWQGESDAPIVHDKFHVSKYLGEAVNMVRKQEHRAFRKDGNDLLTGTKYLFLKNDLEGDDKKRFRAIMEEELGVGRAWALKEAFRHFWAYTRECIAKSYFTHWYFRATHSRLTPIIKVARMLKAHLPGLLSHCRYAISNAVTEGLNSKIQSIKANARGFRNFDHYRIAILFHCGKLDLLPLKS
jgi:transposase